MDLLAAAASGLPVGAMALLAVALLALCAAACWWWPFTSHSRCSGTGKLRSPGGKAWRRCPSCRGTGTKLRIGRRLFNAFSARRPS